MTEKKYNLLSEPWIKVLTNDLKEKEVSLLELFECAHEYKQLAGETPTQNASVFRFLLSVLLTVFYRYNTDGTEHLLCEENGDDSEDVLKRWSEYYERGAFSEGLFSNYLKAYSERFWLFHPQTPFYQVPGLKYGTDCQTYCMIGNIKESNNSATKHHFSMAEGDGINRLNYSEAARWILFYNAYAVNVKSDKKAPGTSNAVGVGRLGELGLIMVEEKTIFNSLMMNMCPLRDGTDLWGEPNPSWEREVCELQSREIVPPNNLPEIYTVISRRILLKDDGEKIVGFRTLGGDYYPVVNVVSEQMTLWKSTVDKKTKKKEERPLRHDPKVHLWREFTTITCEGLGAESESRRPGLIRWIERLAEEELISDEERVTVAAVGMAYGDAMRYTYGEDVYDKLSLSAGLFEELGKTWDYRIADEIKKCEEVEGLIKVLTGSVGDILYGKDLKKKEAEKDKLICDFYFSIDKRFREWISRINPIEDDIEDRMKEWELIAHESAKMVATDYISSLGNAGFRIKTNEKGGTNSIPRLYNYYIRGLKKIFLNRDYTSVPAGKE